LILWWGSFGEFPWITSQYFHTISGQNRSKQYSFERLYFEIVKSGDNVGFTFFNFAGQKNVVKNGKEENTGKTLRTAKQYSLS